MKVTFSTSQIKECTVDVALYLISLALGCEITQDTIERAEDLGYSKYGKLTRKNIITESGKKLISEILLSTEESKEDKDRLTILAEQLWALYPKGRKPGTNLMWKDSVPMIAQKLRTLNKKCKEFGISFTNEEAVAATKRYMESFNGDYTYMQVLKYFIFKKDREKGEDTSQLLSFIQNEDATTDNSSWMDSVR